MTTTQINATSVKEINHLESKIKIHPNPITKSQNLIMEFDEIDVYTISIYNTVGELVDKKVNLSHQVFEYNISNLPVGLYFVKNKNSADNYSIKKILISN